MKAGVGIPRPPPVGPASSYINVTSTITATPSAVLIADSASRLLLAETNRGDGLA
ncbi:MAG: hypothetical protein ACOY3Y_16410 [Acidobacteriota bacterium]